MTDSAARRMAQLGVVIGAILGVIGLMAGFYFGVIQPAIESGRWRALPLQSIWIGGVLLVLILAASIAYLIRWIRGARASPAAKTDDW